MNESTSSPHNFTFHKDHDALLVRDINKSAAFYSRIFGLEEIYSGGLGVKYRWFRFQDKVQIHLIESEERFEPHKGVHLALNVNDLDAFMEHLKVHHVHFENWPGEAGMTNTRPDGIKQIYLQDPDGYWIEVNNNTL